MIIALNERCAIPVRFKDSNGSIPPTGDREEGLSAMEIVKTKGRRCSHLSMQKIRE